MTLRLLPLFALSALGLASPVSAATFCVSTAADLQSALLTAGSNGQHDHIRINTGHYESMTGGFAFAYNSPESLNVLIEGGWQTSGMTPCGIQVDDASLTVLSGGDTRRVLLLTASAGSITLRNLTVRDGVSASRGGGITLGSGDFSGDVLIERVIVRNNRAFDFGGGIDGGSDGGEFRLSNSLLMLNECGVGNCAASLTVSDPSNDDEPRVFLTQNTIVQNACNERDCQNAGLRIGGSAIALIANNVFADNDSSDLRTDAESWLFNNQLNQLTGNPPAQNGGNAAFVDPGFVAPLALNFRLTASSPLLDLGTSGFYQPTVDMDGGFRLNGTQYDLGAFENQQSLFRNSFEPAH